ncbi:MAG: methyltransferase domain-containing protein [Planctomycetota bacterium]|nr:methyltransferase domain-containing protein [Planctomycetota bacterium]
MPLPAQVVVDVRRTEQVGRVDRQQDQEDIRQRGRAHAFDERGEKVSAAEREAARHHADAEQQSGVGERPSFEKLRAAQGERFGHGFQSSRPERPAKSRRRIDFRFLRKVYPRNLHAGSIPTLIRPKQESRVLERTNGHGQAPREVEAEVLRRYAHGAKKREAALCCPAKSRYEKDLLKKLPKEIVEKDYGCGDPSRWVNAGDTVVDLGSGSGKACYILAQKVGRKGRVTGVDFNPAMLELARKYQRPLAKRFGFRNVEFKRARIQDLALDLERAEAWLAEHPASNLDGWNAFEAECERLRQEAPAVPDDFADVVVSNCVLNLVQPRDKERLFGELFRVLKKGGRAVISDVVCDEEPTAATLADPELWSGCIAGAFREEKFLQMFEAAGFHGIEILERQEQPWQVVDGVEYRSMTVRAFKGKQGPCYECLQAVVYRGPFSHVFDDDGHRYPRGVRMAVCEKTFGLLTDPHGPYAGQFIGIEPHTPVAVAHAYDCSGDRVRDPRETKGRDFKETREGEAPACCSGPGSKCC